MRNSLMKKSIGLIAFLVAQTLLQSNSFGQSKDLRPVYLDPAERLTLLKVDTNNIESVKAWMYNKEWHLNVSAVLFLAERGYTNIIPIVKAKYDSAMVSLLSGDYDVDPWVLDYLTALYLLHDSGVIPMTKAFIDTLLTRYNTQTSWRYRRNISDAIRLLACAGDYSQFDNLKMLVKADLQDTSQYWENSDTPNLSDTDFRTLTAYGEKPEYRNDVFNLLREFASNPRLGCREQAAFGLSNYFRDIPEAREIVLKIAQSDPDFDLRKATISYLWILFHDPIAIDIDRQIAVTTNDSVQMENAVLDLDSFASPYAYAALLSSYAQRTPDQLSNIIKQAINYYDAPALLPNVSLIVAIDSLRAYTIECQNLKWIGEREFVNELMNHLANARKHLDRKDSLNSSREIEKYQSEIDKEYRKANGRDNRFVTAAGWKYLYMEAGYIIERLIKLPHKPYATLLQQIDSLKSELKLQEDAKNIGGLLLTKSLELFVNQADKQIQHGDSASLASNLKLFQLLVDETNEYTDELKTRKPPTTYVNDQAYSQLYYLAKYILEKLPEPRESVELQERIDKELQRELEKMKSEAIER